MDDERSTLIGSTPTRGGGGLLGRPPVASMVEPSEDAWKSVPFWSEYGDRPDARIRVQWYDPRTGQPENLGHIGRTCGEAELLHNFPRSGRFDLWLESTSGDRLSDHPKTVNIGEGHLTLQQIRAGASSGTASAGSGTVVVQDTASTMMLQQMMAMMETQRRELLEREAKLADERMKVEELNRGAVSIMTERSAAVNDKVLEQSSQIAAKGQEALTSNFTGLIAVMQTAAAQVAAQQNANNEAFLARMNAQADAERRAAEARIDEAQRRATAEVEAMRERTKQEQMRLDAEAKERRDRLEREETRLRDDADRREKERERLADAERQRQREHSEAMMKLEGEKRDPMATTIATVTTLMGVAEKIGFDPKSMFNKGEGEKAGGGWLETLIQAAGPVVQTYIQAAAGQANAGNGPDEDDDEEPGVLEDPNEIVRVQAPDGRIVQMTRAQMIALSQGQAPQVVAPPQTQAAPGNVIPFPPQAATPPQEAPQSFPPWGGPSTQAPPVQNLPGPAAVPVTVPPPPPVPSPAEAAMSVTELKAARAAARTMVAKLSNSPEATWPGVFLGAMMANAGLKQYLMLVTIEGALTEIGTTGANPALAARILAVADANFDADNKKFVRKAVL
jgi:hypothetical protein